ncbi:hypothetical protein QBC40DRAFT_351918 [Triangularia verruculosa]|uniref:Uncharacterized protein n=1 Tax=Triangularia verruculosa TaxID=2587418 RepID=A0AAN6X937_9PEZI|nr:hypothetical protein QBC40DRAFT_351918 [Triangularia verruculosa]
MGLIMSFSFFGVVWFFLLHMLLGVEAHGRVHHGAHGGPYRGPPGAFYGSPNEGHQRGYHPGTLAPGSRWHAAQPTHFHAEAPDWDHGSEESPVPTAPPDSLHRLRDLSQRQNARSTCAYIQGDLNKPVTCNGGLVCSTVHGHVGCCPTTAGCDIATACLDNTAFSRGLCNNLGPFTTCCSNTASAFCNSLTYHDRPYMTMIGCAGSPQQVMIHAVPATSGTAATTSVRRPTRTTTSIGVIIGAAIGAVVFFVLAAALVIFLCKRRKKQQHLREQDQDYYDAIHPRDFALTSPSPGPAVSERSGMQHSAYPFDSARSSMFKPVWGQDMPAPAPPTHNHPLNSPWPLSPYEAESISPGTAPVVQPPVDMHANGKRRDNVYEMRT